jgi:hypothetical protein
MQLDGSEQNFSSVRCTSIRGLSPVAIDGFDHVRCHSHWCRLIDRSTHRNAINEESESSAMVSDDRRCAHDEARVWSARTVSRSRKSLFVTVCGRRRTIPRSPFHPCGLRHRRIVMTSVVVVARAVDHLVREWTVDGPTSTIDRAARRSQQENGFDRRHQQTI